MIFTPTATRATQAERERKKESSLIPLIQEQGTNCSVLGGFLACSLSLTLPLAFYFSFAFFLLILSSPLLSLSLFSRPPSPPPALGTSLLSLLPLLGIHFNSILLGLVKQIDSTTNFSFLIALRACLMN